MRKMLYYAAIMGCLTMFSLVFAACNDEEDVDNPSAEEVTPVYADGVEGVTNYFYETDSKGNKTLVMGTALNNQFPDELSMKVADEVAAYGQFYAMITRVDSVFVVEHVDGSIEATLTDTLGNARGIALFTPATGNGVLATVTFSDGVIDGVSKVDFIETSAWPANDDVKTVHNRFRVVEVDAPTVSKECLYPTPTKKVNMVCCNTATKDIPAYYAYFDADDSFCPEKNYLERNGSSWSVVKKYLPNEETTTGFVEQFGLPIKTYYPSGWYRDEQTAKYNLKALNDVLGVGGVKIVEDQCYFSSYNLFTTVPRSLYIRLPERRYYYFSFFNFKMEYAKDGDFGKHPYMMIKRVKYDQEWNGEF